MLRVYDDQISGWYRTHMSHNGWSSTCDWKGYKTPFRRSGHICATTSYYAHLVIGYITVTHVQVK